MRKGCDRENGKMGSISLAVKGALTYHLQHCTACKIQNGRQRAQKWITGLEKGLTLEFWVLQTSFIQKFLLLEQPFH